MARSTVQCALLDSKMCLGVEEWLVLVVMSMYTGAKTVVRTAYGKGKGKEYIYIAHLL